MVSTSIYTFVQEQESDFETQEIKVADNWNWNLRNHVQLIFQLKNGVFSTGSNKFLRAFKNIMEPVLNLAYWSEDIEVKDVVFYIEDVGGRVLSFLVKKYHDEVFVKENDLDTMFDRLAESDIDYGGVLVQKNGTACPEVMRLKDIAFCDQTDILGAPIGFKKTYAPEKLRAMSEYGWGDKKNGATISIEDLIALADETKTPAGDRTRENKTPGKQIEVFIVRGNLPEHYLYDDENMDDYCYQLQIVALYTDKDNNKQGVTLYRKDADPDDLMFHTSQPVEDRALGRGAGESLLHPQVWTNFLTIHKMNMLEAASKVPLYTDDGTYTQKNKIQDMENLEITTIEDGKRIFQVPTAAPANLQLMEKEIDKWHEQAQYAGSAFDPMMGKEAVSGTTFRGQNQVVQQGRGLHERRRGQRAKFIELIYRELVIPAMVKEMVKGKKFLATLSAEELTWVTDQLVINESNNRLKDMILRGETPTQEEADLFKEVIREDFKKKGNKHLLEILKAEMKDIEIKMGINIAGKQKNLAAVSDKLLSIFQTAFSNPQQFQMTMQIPGMSSAFGNILEYGGMNPVDFSALLTASTTPVIQAPVEAGGAPTKMPEGAPAA